MFAQFLLHSLEEAWHLLLDSSVYIIFGIVTGGLLRIFLNPSSVVRHLGTGRFRSVVKAAAFGVPIPLCSCGVLPAALSLKKQGANTGATTAFLISTPESGVDSIAISYALLDPIMTIARPVVGMVTAMTAGITENLFSARYAKNVQPPDLSCPVDGCCDGNDCSPEEHSQHHTWQEKIIKGMRYAFGELWADIAPLFFLGILLSGFITVLVPSEYLSAYLGGGISSMLLMLVIGIPLYICATASTPVAATLILKGVSPGAALVFLIAGPATNITSLTVLTGVLGKRATTIYLLSIAGLSVFFGLLLDWLYSYSGLSAQAMVGQAAELIPPWAQLVGTILLIVFSVKPVYAAIRKILSPRSSQESCECSSCDSDKSESNPEPC